MAKYRLKIDTVIATDREDAADAISVDVNAFLNALEVAYSSVEAKVSLKHGRIRKPKESVVNQDVNEVA